MSEYERTAIRRLSIAGLRSVRSLDLQDIPDLVILHGPNGSGKSNLLLAVGLVLRAAGLPGDLPVSRDRAVTLRLVEADKLLGLRPDDFHFGGEPEIRIQLDVALGTKAADIISARRYDSLGLLSMELVVQRSSESGLRYWFERADFAGKISLGPGKANALGQLTSEQVGFLAERVRNTLLPRLLQLSPAYRVPGSMDDPENALFQAFLSEDPIEREAARRLSRRLAKARLFGVSTDAVALLPVRSTTYGEQQVRFNHPIHGELPLRNLGSGEQQIVYMLGQRVVAPFPIAQLEEPEAHLHTSLMEPFARVLLDSISGEGGTPDVDQLWIATHHHHFALAREYFDVQIVDGATMVTRQPRAKAARHFFEPGPIWEALRQIAMSAKDREAVVFRGTDGQPVTAAQVLDSIENDPEQRLAKEYANAMTEAMVRAMRQRSEAQT